MSHRETIFSKPSHVFYSDRIPNLKCSPKPSVVSYNPATHPMPKNIHKSSYRRLHHSLKAQILPHHSPAISKGDISLQNPKRGYKNRKNLENLGNCAERGTFLAKTDQEEESIKFQAERQPPSNSRKDKQIQQRFEMGVLTDLESIREPKKESQIPQYIPKNQKTFSLKSNDKQYKGKKTADRFYYGIYL